MLCSRNLPIRYRNTSLRELFNRGSYIEAENVGRYPRKSIIALYGNSKPDIRGLSVLQGLGTVCLWGGAEFFWVDS